MLAAQRWINDALGLGGAALMAEQVLLAGVLPPLPAVLDAIAAIMRLAGLRDFDLAARTTRHLAAAHPIAAGIPLIPDDGIPTPSVPRQLSGLDDDPAVFGICATLALDALMAPSLTTAAESLDWLITGLEQSIDAHLPPDSGIDRIDTLIQTPVRGGHSALLDAILLRHREPSMKVFGCQTDARV